MFSTKLLAFSICISLLVAYMTNGSILWMIVTYTASNLVFHLMNMWYCRPYKSNTNPKHLIVIVTGWMGHYTPLKPLQDSFKKYLANNNEGFMIYLAQCNSNGLFLYAFRKTNEGIDVGGHRLFNEIKSVLQSNSSICKISFVSCSLGGLYSRYCLKLLFDGNSNSFKINNRIIEAINFITLASPHCGVKDWLKNAYWNVCGYKISLYKYSKLVPSATIQQLALRDKQHLLTKMASTCEYLQPLLLFQNRVCFGNGRYDRFVSCSSSLLLFGAKEANIGIHFYDKMISDNNKHSVEQINGNPANVNFDKDCWYHGLRQMKWTKVVVCWDKHIFGKRIIHKQTAVGYPIFDTIIKNFKC